MQLILIHDTRPAHIHINDVRLPPAVVAVKLQNTHAALASANTFQKLSFRQCRCCNAVNLQDKIACKKNALVLVQGNNCSTNQIELRARSGQRLL